MEKKQILGLLTISHFTKAKEILSTLGFCLILNSVLDSPDLIGFDLEKRILCCFSFWSIEDWNGRECFGHNVRTHIQCECGCVGSVYVFGLWCVFNSQMQIWEEFAENPWTQWKWNRMNDGRYVSERTGQKRANRKRFQNSIFQFTEIHLFLNW